MKFTDAKAEAAFTEGFKQGKARGDAEIARLREALEAIAQGYVNSKTDHQQLTALFMAIARAAVSDIANG